MKRLALRTGVRWKISIAIAAVGALIAVALSLVVHNAARVSMLENAREVQLERLLFAQRLYEASNTQKPSPKFGAKLNDPAMPSSLRDQVRNNRRATHVDEYAGGVPDVWAAVPLANGDVLSLHTRFADRNATIMGDLDRALVIGSVSVVFGGCALGSSSAASCHADCARQRQRRARWPRATRTYGYGRPSAASYGTKPMSWPARSTPSRTR